MIVPGKTISLKEIIAKIYRDLNLTEEANIIDYVEWAAEALEKIGSVSQLEAKTIEVDLDNYKAPLPCDLVDIKIVTYNDYPLTTATDLLGPRSVNTRSSLPYSPYIEKYKNKTFIADSGFENVIGRDGYTLDYILSGGYIKTGLETGKLKIVYNAIPTDCDGYPMIPDYIEYKDAIYWYINMKYSYAEWRRGALRDGIYQHAEQRWHWYCQQAANRAMMPGLAQLENIKDQYLRLKPDLYRFQELFN